MPDEPITLAQAKAHCRVLDDSEDSLFPGWIKAAREWVEEYTDHILVRRPLSFTVDSFGRCIEIKRRPVASVDAVRITDSDGADRPFTDWLANPAAYPVRLHPVGAWPTIGENGWVRVTYTAGYAVGEVPQPLLQAMFLLIGHYFANRDAVIAGTTSGEVPLGVVALCDRYRQELA